MLLFFTCLLKVDFVDFGHLKVSPEEGRFFLFLHFLSASWNSDTSNIQAALYIL
jgi:hypothetical protein